MQQNISDERLAEIEQRAARATPGKWTWFNGCSWWRLGVTDRVGQHDAAVLRPYVANDGHPDMRVREEDREFIAEARTDIPDLITEVKALRAELQARRAAERWIPVAERLPDDRRQVLVYMKPVPEGPDWYPRTDYVLAWMWRGEWRGTFIDPFTGKIDSGEFPENLVTH